MSADAARLAETVRYALSLVPRRRTQNPLGPWRNDPKVDTALATLDELVLISEQRRREVLDLKEAATALAKERERLVLEHTRQEEALRAYEAAVQEGLLVAPNHWHQYRDPFELDPAIRQARALVRALSPPPVASGENAE